MTKQEFIERFFFGAWNPTWGYNETMYQNMIDEAEMVYDKIMEKVPTQSIGHLWGIPIKDILDDKDHPFRDYPILNINKCREFFGMPPLES